MMSNQAKFEARLAKSIKAQEVIAKYLELVWRVEVKINYPVIGEQDDGDIELIGYIGPSYKVEVKQYNKLDLSGGSWPYPKLLVCNRAAFDRYIRPPLYYFYLGKDFDYLYGLSVNLTREYWEVDELFVEEFNHFEEAYFCPIPIYYHGLEIEPGQVFKIPEQVKELCNV